MRWRRADELSQRSSPYDEIGCQGRPKMPNTQATMMPSDQAQSEARSRTEPPNGVAMLDRRRQGDSDSEENQRRTDPKR